MAGYGVGAVQLKLPGSGFVERTGVEAARRKARDSFNAWLRGIPACEGDSHTMAMVISSDRVSSLLTRGTPGLYGPCFTSFTTSVCCPGAR